MVLYANVQYLNVNYFDFQIYNDFKFQSKTIRDGTITTDGFKKCIKMVHLYCKMTIRYFVQSILAIAHRLIKFIFISHMKYYLIFRLKRFPCIVERNVLTSLPVIKCFALSDFYFYVFTYVFICPVDPFLTICVLDSACTENKYSLSIKIFLFILKTKK